MAAIFLEPVQGEGGVNPATAEYFAGVRQLCDEAAEGATSLVRVLATLVLRRLPVGGLAIREGEPGNSFFFVASGTHAELLAATQRLIAECPCENGCPGCVGPIGNTGPLAKTAALRILDLLLTDRIAA